MVGWVNGWGQVKSLKFNKSWPNQDNSIFLEDLWFVETPPPMSWYVGGWVVQWVDGWGSTQITKSLINLDLIEIIHFCWKFMICRDTPTHGCVFVCVCVCVCRSVGQWLGSVQITNYRINLDVSEIIQFCLKIHDLWRHPHPWVGVCGSVGKWVGSVQITNYRINLDLIEIIQFCLKIYDF